MAIILAPLQTIDIMNNISTLIIDYTPTLNSRDWKICKHRNRVLCQIKGPLDSYRCCVLFDSFMVCLIFCSYLAYLLPKSFCFIVTSYLGYILLLLKPCSYSLLYAKKCK